MTAEEKNVQLLRKGYALWNSETGATEGVRYWLNLLADDVRWRSLANGVPGLEFTGRCHSKAEVQGYFEVLGANWELIEYRTDEYIAQGDRVVMLGACKWKSNRTGKLVESPKADVFRFRDGKVVDFMEFYDTAAALAATA